MKNNLKSSVLTSLLLVVLGILLVFESELTIKTISYVIGAVLVAAGTFALIRYINNNKKGFETSELDILYGIVTIVLGILVIANPHAIASIIPIVLGIAIIISSAVKIQYAFDLKNSENDLWKTTMVIAVVGTICGIVLLFNPFEGAVMIMKIVGIFILIYAILDLISTYIIKRNVDAFKNTIEQEVTVPEAEVVDSNGKKEQEKSKKRTTKKTNKNTK